MSEERIDYLARDAAGQFHPVSKDELVAEFAGKTFQYLSSLLRGRVIVDWDEDGGEYELSFNQDGEGFFRLSYLSNDTNWTSPFKQVECGGKDVYFLVENDTVHMTLRNFDDTCPNIACVFDALSRGEQ